MNPINKIKSIPQIIKKLCELEKAKDTTDEYKGPKEYVKRISRVSVFDTVTWNTMHLYVYWIDQDGTEQLSSYGISRSNSDSLIPDPNTIKPSPVNFIKSINSLEYSNGLLKLSYTSIDNIVGEVEVTIPQSITTTPTGTSTPVTTGLIRQIIGLKKDDDDSGKVYLEYKNHDDTTSQVELDFPAHLEYIKEIVGLKQKSGKYVLEYKNQNDIVLSIELDFLKGLFDDIPRVKSITSLTKTADSKIALSYLDKDDNPLQVKLDTSIQESEVKSIQGLAYNRTNKRFEFTYTKQDGTVLKTGIKPDRIEIINSITETNGRLAISYRNQDDQNKTVGTNLNFVKSIDSFTSSVDSNGDLILDLKYKDQSNTVVSLPPLVLSEGFVKKAIKDITDFKITDGELELSYVDQEDVPTSKIIPLSFVKNIVDFKLVNNDLQLKYTDHTGEVLDKSVDLGLFNNALRPYLSSTNRSIFPLGVNSQELLVYGSNFDENTIFYVDQGKTTAEVIKSDIYSGSLGKLELKTNLPGLIKIKARNGSITSLSEVEVNVYDLKSLEPQIIGDTIWQYGNEPLTSGDTKDDFLLDSGLIRGNKSSISRDNLGAYFGDFGGNDEIELFFQHFPHSINSYGIIGITSNPKTATNFDDFEFAIIFQKNFCIESYTSKHPDDSMAIGTTLNFDTNNLYRVHLSLKDDGRFISFYRGKDRLKVSEIDYNGTDKLYIKIFVYDRLGLDQIKLWKTV